MSISALRDESAWAAWIPLDGCGRGKAIPACPGLYRISLMQPGDQSVSESRQMAYIGQSSNLKERLGALKHVYDSMMPGYTPHVAAPALWGWRQHLPASSYEVSVAPFPCVPGPLRLGLECLALALCQEQHGISPLVNFGRTCDEWNALWQGTSAHRAVETEPLAPLTLHPHRASWCGLRWSPWQSLRDGQGFHFPGETQTGLYRLRVADCDPLLFVGQGKIAARLKTYRSTMPLECSWVIAPWSYHRRLELACCAVGAHLLSLASVPLWQFEEQTPFDTPTGYRAA